MINDITPYQRRVLRLLCEGLSDRAIADQLGTTTEAVGCSMQRIYKHLGVEVGQSQYNSRVRAVLIAIEHGLDKEMFVRVTA